jgi:hypothetical protein
MNNSHEYRKSQCILCGEMFFGATSPKNLPRASHLTCSAHASLFAPEGIRTRRQSAWISPLSEPWTRSITASTQSIRRVSTSTSQKVVVVTGASQGIGAEVVKTPIVTPQISHKGASPGADAVNAEQPSFRRCPGHRPTDSNGEGRAYRASACRQP